MKKTMALYISIFVVIGFIYVSFVQMFFGIENVVSNPFTRLFIILGLALITWTLNYMLIKREINTLKGESEDLKFKNIMNSLYIESTTTTNRHDFYQLILLKTLEAIPYADKGSILRRSDNNKMLFEASSGHDIEVLKQVQLSLKETFLYLKTDGKLNKTMIIDDFINVNEQHIDSDRQETLDGFISDMKTVMSTPIWVNDTLWGMINIDSFTPKAFDQESINSAEIFAAEIAKTINLFDVLERNNYLLRYDVLTDVFNRDYFNEITKETIETLSAIDDKALGVMVSIDLDKFKSINDHYGHMSGDKYLITFARGIKGFVDSSIIFARYGGDEFMMFFSDRNIAEVKEVMHKIEVYFDNNRIHLGSDELVIKFSYGLAQYPDDGSEAKALYKISDERMYDNKNIKLSTKN